MVERPARPDLFLEDLAAGAEQDFVIARLHEGFEFTEMDLSGERLLDRELIECRISGALLDQSNLQRSRIRETELIDCRATSLDMGAADLRDVEVTDSRFGDLQLYDAELRRVKFVGCRLGYLNLRSAKVLDLSFTGCLIDELDLGMARVNRLAFDGCEVKCLSVGGSQLVDVDLRGAQLGEIADLSGLSGATISPNQLLELAPALAGQFGISIA